MSFPTRPIAFVLSASNHGTMIVNRNDFRMIDATHGYGVGYQILNKSCFDPDEVRFALALLDCRRKHFGNGVVAIDGGANIGVHTVEWSRHMHGWGRVIGFEAQEFVYYALAGNVALNNCLNAKVLHAALGESRGELDIPQPDHHMPASFGSLELRQSAKNEFIGQQVSYAANACAKVSMVNLDSLPLDRLDLLKLDVEGMELEVLRGGQSLLAKHRPILIVEAIKTDRAALEASVTALGYRVFAMGINILAIHGDDATLNHIKQSGNSVSLTLNI